MVAGDGIFFKYDTKEGTLHRGLLCEGAQISNYNKGLYLYIIPIMSNCLSFCCDLGNSLNSHEVRQ